MRETINDLKLLRIDLFSIIIYYPLIRLVYSLSLVFSFITPNLITLLGLFQFLICASLFLLLDAPIILSISLFVFAWMDVTDGFLARKKKLGSKLGAVLDICSDRLVFFVLTWSYGYFCFKEPESKTELLIFFTYAFLFIFLDTIHLIAGQVKTAIGIDKKNTPSAPNTRWWLNQEFRFASYLFICIWIYHPETKALAWTAITLVVMDYLSFLNKSIKSLRATK